MAMTTTDVEEVEEGVEAEVEKELYLLVLKNQHKKYHIIKEHNLKVIK